MILSPFTPLFFISHKTDGIGSDYIQTFSTSDRILIQLIGRLPWSGIAQVFMEPGHKLMYQVKWNEWTINEDVQLLFSSFTLPPGYYSVFITGFRVSEIFRVTDDDTVLSETTLIQYSMKNNRQRNDAVFFIDGMQYFFDFRVHGGFKDSGWSFSCESEQFVTQSADISQLYSLESTQKRFTLGSSMGVPVWFGEMLNRILSCSHVYFDGVKYCRKESNTPELAVQLEGVDSFVFTQTLQRSVNLDPKIEHDNQMALRRHDDNRYRAVSTNINRIIY